MMSNFSVLSKNNAVTGTDIYRLEDTSIPLAYRPRVEHTVNPNKEGTNHMVTVKVSVPVVNTVDGVAMSKDTFYATLKYTSLQTVTAEVQRLLALTALEKYIDVARADIASGQLPDDGYTMPTV